MDSQSTPPSPAQVQLSSIMQYHPPIGATSEFVADEIVPDHVTWALPSPLAGMVSLEAAEAPPSQPATSTAAALRVIPSNPRSHSSWLMRAHIHNPVTTHKPLAGKTQLSQRMTSAKLAFNKHVLRKPVGMCPFANTDIAVSVRAGDILWLEGPSGVGKTSIVRHLCGLATFPFSEVTFRLDWNDVPSAERIGMLFQLGVMVDTLNVHENIELAARTAGKPYASDDVARHLKRVGLVPARDGPKRPGHLSGGMLRRACLAQILAQEKRVIVLDEPFVGLDKKVALEILSVLKTLAAESGVAFILISHQKALIRELGPTQILRLLPKSVSVEDAQQGMKGDPMYDEEAAGEPVAESDEDCSNSSELLCLDPAFANRLVGGFSGTCSDTENSLQPQSIASRTGLGSRSGLSGKAGSVSKGNNSNFLSHALTRLRSLHSEFYRLGREALIYLVILWTRCTRENYFWPFRRYELPHRFALKVYDYLFLSTPLIVVAFLALGLAMSSLFAELLNRVDPIELLKDVPTLQGIIPILEAADPELTNSILAAIKSKIYAIAVAYVFCVELAPLICGLLLSGRLGGSYSGEVAMMSATNQNSLLKTLNISSQRWSLIPSLFAALIAGPALTWISLMIAIWAGGLVAQQTKYSYFDSYAAYYEIANRAIWEKGSMDTSVYPPVVCTYRALTFAFIVIVVPEILIRYRPELHAGQVSKTITWGVVLSGLVLILADLGFNAALTANDSANPFTSSTMGEMTTRLLSETVTQMVTAAGTSPH